MTKDKVLITGANGLLGSYILRYLIQNGIDVRATFRKGSDLTLVNDIKEKVEWFEADMTDYLMMEKAMEGCNRIIHSAAVVSYSKKDRSTMIKINVNGTKNLVDLALANNIDHFIHISSIAAIGRPKTSKLLNEETKWEKSQYNTVYGQSKFLSELEVWRAKEEGMEVAIINPSVVLAPGDWDKSSAKIFKYVWKEKPFYTSGTFNYIDVRDLVEIIIQVNRGILNGERVIASAGKISYHDFLTMAALHFNKKAPTIKIGSGFIRLLALFEQVRSRLTGSDPLITPETARLAHAGIFFDNTKIKDAMGFDFRPLDDTLRWCSSKYADQLRIA